jgi:hypothetical protein
MSQPSWQEIQHSLLPLCERGFFTRIFGWNDPKTLIIDCALYFTDTDEHGNPAGLFTIDSVENMRNVRNEHNHCICCDELPQKTMAYKHGSIACPVCSAWTKPGTLRQREFRGLFHFAVGETPFFVAPTGGEKGLPDRMTNPEQIEAITQALSSVRMG